LRIANQSEAKKAVAGKQAIVTHDYGANIVAKDQLDRWYDPARHGNAKLYQWAGTPYLRWVAVNRDGLACALGSFMEVCR